MIRGYEWFSYSVLSNKDMSRISQFFLYEGLLRSILRKSLTNSASVQFREFVTKNSPGNRRVVPRTISAADAEMSLLNAERCPRSTTGRISHQSDVWWQIIDALRVRWNLSMIPLDCGWYGVVLRWVIVVNSRNRADSNCLPRSVVILIGTPNREIQPETKWRATVLAVMSDIGMASGQRVNLSIPVRQYRKSREVGIGPMMSTLICWKRWSDRLKFDNADLLWRFTLARWQGIHCLTNCVQSLLMLGQTNRCWTSFAVGFVPGWLMLCYLEIPSLRKRDGMNGRIFSFDVSQYIKLVESGTANRFMINEVEVDCKIDFSSSSSSCSRAMSS